MLDNLVNRIHCGDCIEIMSEMPDECIDLVATSPPYDNIRTYEKYTLDLHVLGQQLNDVLVQGGVCIMIIQDQTVDGAKTLTSFRTIVDWCDSTNLRLFECCIYSKQGRPGAWWQTRFRVDHEHIAIFVKGQKPNYFNKDHMTKHLDYEWKASGTIRQTDGSLSDNTSDLIYSTKTQGTIFKYNSSAREHNKLKLQHPATMPDKLAADLIDCFSKPEGLVMDPLCGSGTTAVAAKQLGRRFIGIDISEKYCKIARQRLAQEYLF